MIHNKRKYNVDRVDSAAELAEKLKQCTWCLCTGFELEGYLFLNDSFTEDSAQEYAVIRDGRQLESITFSWCTPEDALAHIKAVLDGRYDDVDYAYDVEPKIEPAAEHEPCPLCR